MTGQTTPSPEPRTSGECYTHGYHEVIVGSYTLRTAEACAGFLLPRLRPDMLLLDLGCGPGTITAGLARRVGRVVGLDASAEMVDAARNHAAESEIDNATFEVGSAYDLPWPDDSFDVVYAHQVHQHLSQPVQALQEARRVLRPGGIVALRDSDYETMVHAPVAEEIVRWRELYHQVHRANGGEPDAGRHLLSWVTEAGFVEPEVTTDSVTHATAEARAFWGQMWAVRVIDSDFARHAVDHGLSTRAELQEISDAFRRWSRQPSGFWAYLCGEVIAVCP